MDDISKLAASEATEKSSVIKFSQGRFWELTLYWAKGEEPTEQFHVIPCSRYFPIAISHFLR